MLTAAPIARRTFLIVASYTDRRAGRFPTVPRIARNQVISVSCVTPKL
jgi:hypothetical protein